MSTGRRSNEKCSVVILGTPYRESSKNDIRIHVSSLFRFTYRKDFPTLNPYPISSDAGWGCMLRSAQMLMACALQRHLLGRDWRKSDKISVLRATNHYCDILKLFSDYPGPPHVYSIHHLVQCGMRYDKLPGEWFGPSTAALVLRDLTKLHRKNYGGTLEILVTQGDTIYVRDCEDLCALKTISTSDKKEEATDAKEKVTINGTTSGNHTNGSNSGVENGSRTGHVEDNTLNSISEDDTMFSNCTEDIHTTVAADFIRSHSDKTIDNATDPTLFRTKTANTISDAKNGKNGENGETEISTKSQSVTSTPQHSVSMSNSTRPIFDPLFNPPPSHTAPWACSLVVCIPLRLGITSVSPEYIEELKELLRTPCCLGFVGGRMNHAIYFVGYKMNTNGGTELLGLDPHSVYPANKDDPFPSAELVSQVHVHELDVLEASRLDPSLAIAFYFKNRDEFDLFCAETRTNVDKKRSAGLTPLFCVEHSAPSYGSHGWSGDDHGEEDDIDCEDDEYILV